MTDSVPYWQFENARWLTGKIASYPLAEQGLYLHLCMMAWNGEGSFNVRSTTVARRFHVDPQWVDATMAEFIEDGIVEANAGGLRIKFLAEQRKTVDAMREQRSAAGRASARARAESATSPSPTPPPQEKREEESIVEYSRALNKRSTPVEHPLNVRSTAATKKPASKSKQETALPDWLTSLDGFTPALWDAWMQTRRKKRAATKGHAVELLLRKLQKHPERAVEAIECAVEAGWSGFEWSWIDDRRESRSGRSKRSKQVSWIDVGNGGIE